MATEAERAFATVSVRAPHEPQWLSESRDGAMRAFEAEGLPHHKIEAYHYTNLKALLRGPYPPLAIAAVKGVFAAHYRSLARRLNAHVVPIINGLVRDDLATRQELPVGSHMMPLGAALVSAPEIARLAFEFEPEGRVSAVRALNKGLARDGMVIRVRAENKAPLIVLHHNANLERRGSVHLRHLIVLEEGAEASVLEIFESEGAPSLTTSETIIRLARNARLLHTKLVKGDASAVQLGRTDARAAAGADYRLFIQGAGAGLAREEVEARLEGEGAHSGLAGAQLLSGERHFDVTARIEHVAPRCTSDMAVRSALGGSAKGIVQGAVHVALGAQHTDARQLIRGLLLSPRAEFDAKPELAIFADDVKCSHGAASGDLDAEALFYLRARGIAESEARALLTEAFLEEGFARVPDEAVRELLREEARTWLESLDMEAGRA